MKFLQDMIQECQFSCEKLFSGYYKEFMILPGWKPQILSHFTSWNRKKIFGLRQNRIIMTHKVRHPRNTALFRSKNH